MSINQALAEFKATDYTPKLCEAVLKVMPYSPDYVHFTTLDEAVAALRPRASAADIERVRAMDKDETLNDVLWMAKLLDTDDQQRNDAVLKALGLAYMIYKAYPGSIAEKANLFRSTPTGQALALYYASVEVALPFADNALVKGGNILEDLFSKEGGEQMSRLTSMAGDHGIEGAQSMLTSIAEPLKRVVDHASNYVQPVAESAKKYVPAVMDGADKVAGVVASGADVLPVYRLLGARLAAEGAIIRALGTASNA
jgi:hypothetical protein